MRVLIIGCGRMGAGLAQVMSLRGHFVTVIDKDPNAFRRLPPNFKGQTVVGVGFDRDVLRTAGIEQTDALAAVTASDEANVVAARIARQIFKVPKVVARLYDPAEAEAYDRLGLENIAPVSWGVSKIADLLSHSNLDVETSLGTGQVNLVVATLPPMLEGKTVNMLTIPAEVHVVAITRSGRTFLPTLGTVFQSGDQIHLVVLVSAMNQLDQMLKQAGG
jgi:trk system potassium uptake protein TrkA